MNLIVSTPQGEAEFSVATHESVTVRELLSRLMTPPALVHIDGRPVPIGTLVNAAGIVSGSTIALSPPEPTAAAAAVTLVQAAGDGGGHRQALAPGRYIVGTARRANVDPLTFNEVLVPRCDVAVEHSGEITVTAVHGELDGVSAHEPSRWRDEFLRIGHRIFRVDGPINDRANLMPTASGRLWFTPTFRDPASPVLGLPGRGRTGGRRRLGRRSGRAMPDPVQPSPDDAAKSAFDSELAGLRRDHLDIAEVVRRATERSSHLWERRVTDEDAFAFNLGFADQPWFAADPAHAYRPDLAILPTVPVLVDLLNQRGVGFAGAPPQARAAARALIMQACVAHGPADIDIVVLASPTGAARWEWIKWLPHAQGSRGVQILSDAQAIADWTTAERTLTTVVASIQSLGRPITPSRLTIAVLDDPTLWRGRTAPLNALFAEAQLPVRFIALSDRADDIPAVCTTVMRLEANGAADVTYPMSGRTVADVVPFVLAHDVALAAARKLSPLDNDDGRLAHKPALPTLISLTSLIDPDGLDGGGLLSRWNSSAKHASVTIGVTDAGPMVLDLLAGDSHMLIVGAPRAGKSELLRTIASALAATVDPGSLGLLLIDGSTGATFEVLSQLPHIVGMASDLDDRRCSRLLRALRAELGRRAQVAKDDAVAGGALPTLVVAIDDADAIAATSPEFLGNVVELIESYPHLGVHLVIACQQVPRPLSQRIKQLCEIRVALRVLDPSQSVEIIGHREATHIALHTPGLGYIKTGNGAAVTVQFAAASAAANDLVEIRPFTVARELNALERKMIGRAGTVGRGNEHDAGVGSLTSAAAAALADRGAIGNPPIVHPELPTSLSYEALVGMAASISGDSGAPYALDDLPDAQTQRPRRWLPARDGNLLIIGGTAAERSSSVATMLVAATDHLPAEGLKSYVIVGSTSNQLVALEALPGCGAVVGSDDAERLQRLLTHLDSDLDQRLAHSTAGRAHQVLVVDDISVLTRALELGDADSRGLETIERLVAHGPRAGVSVLVTSGSDAGVPASLLRHFASRVVLQLDDRRAYRALGVDGGRIPVQIAGRAITMPEQVETQVASLGDLASAVAMRAERPALLSPPLPVPTTPTSVSLDTIIEAAAFDGHSWRLPVGINTLTLAPIALHVPRGGGAMIVGDIGTGKSLLLATLACGALHLGDDVSVYVVAATSGPLLALPGLAGATTLLGIEQWATQLFEDTDRPRLVLIDDADRAGDAILERLAALDDPSITVIVAGRTRQLANDDHWTSPIRNERRGVIVRPLASDGIVFGLQLQLNAAQLGEGRGLLVDQDSGTPILIATPPPGTYGELR
jgi:DNA segregation ATPase FtsK/SpoIIIE, S-DNA-T family